VFAQLFQVIMSHPPILQVRELSYSYQGRKAVDSISFSIGKGEFFGLLGPNGAGKSTTISCIAGLLSRWQGQILFSDQPFSPAISLRDRRRIGIVPQDLAIYENLTARENLKTFGGLCGLSGKTLQQAVDRQLQIAGLVERANDLVKTYSGGMKRRLNLACGLIHQPEMVLLDEPTVGVDPQSRSHLFDLLKQVQAEGTTILYTTHYMEEAQRLCDRIGILHGGKMIASGTSKELATGSGLPEASLEQVFLKLTGRSLQD
jgi:ABC-2 type transport system ATP-binding protein